MENTKPDAEPTPPAETSTPTRDHTMGMLCHLLSLVAILGIPLGNILGPLIIWLIKRNEDPFVDACGKESLNFQISATIAGAGLTILAFPLAVIPFLNFIFVPAIMLLIFGLVIAVIIFSIIASVKASEGESYQYPYSFHFIK